MPHGPSKRSVINSSRATNAFQLQYSSEQLFQYPNVCSILILGVIFSLWVWRVILGLSTRVPRVCPSRKRSLHSKLSVINCPMRMYLVLVVPKKSDRLLRSTQTSHKNKFQSFKLVPCIDWRKKGKIQIKFRGYQRRWTGFGSLY